MARKSAAAKVVVTAVQEDLPAGSVVLTLPKAPHRIVTIGIAGDEQGLLQNNMKLAEKMKIANKGRKDLDPENNEEPDYSKKVEEWKQTAHATAEGKHGHPCESFLKAMGRVIDQVKLSNGEPMESMKALNCALSIIPDGLGTDGKSLVFFTNFETPPREPEQLVMELTPMTMEPACHWAVIQGRTPVPVYRTHLKNWQMSVRVRYNPNVLRAKDVLALLSYAGEHIGIGAYRPENRGVYGRFTLVSATDSGS